MLMTDSTPNNRMFSPQNNKIIPWLLTLFLHSLILLGAYLLYQRTAQGNQLLANASPTQPNIALSAPALTEQKITTKMRADSNTPIAINQEKYAPSPKVRSDLPILTTATIIAEGNAIRAAQNDTVAESTVASTTALTTLSAVSSTSKTAIMIESASDKTLAARDMSAKDKKNPPQMSKAEDTVDEGEIKTKTNKGKLQKTESTKQATKDATHLSKSTEETSKELNKNSENIKNKPAQKIVKEFNVPQPETTKPTAEEFQKSDFEPAIAHKKSK